MDALLVIDMQKECFELAERFDREGMVRRINELSRRFRQLGRPVVFVRHDGTAEKYLIPGTPGWEILDELETRKGDIFIGKTANDAFCRTDLERVLSALGVDRLYIAGCATDFCVNATVHGALVRDYRITVVADCHTTATREFDSTGREFEPADCRCGPPGRRMLAAEELIAFHNWLWANLTPTGGSISVQPLADVLGEMA